MVLQTRKKRTRGRKSVKRGGSGAASGLSGSGAASSGSPTATNAILLATTASNPLGLVAATQTIVNKIQEPAVSTYVPPHIEDPPCHPSILPEARRTGTCLEPADIELIRKKWNESNATETIPRISTAVTRRKMGEVLSERCAHSDNPEYCWISQPFVGGEQVRLKHKFRIVAPESWKSDPTTWLDSNNIYGCLKQLSEAYPWFETIYPSPVDFDKRIYDEVYNGECVVNELCNLDTNRDLRKKGKTAYGVVFNLDPHDKPGSHWVALYINLGETGSLQPGANVASGSGLSGSLRPGAYYWDSYGIKAPARIKTLMKRIQEQEGGPSSFIIRENAIQHQKKGSECGIYSLYFITSLVEGRSFEDVTRNIVDDDTINRFRKVYFVSV